MSTVLPDRDWVYADDLRVGEEIDLGTRTVTEDGIVGFARQWDPQWFHTDPDAAGDGPYGGLIASGIQTLAIYHRMFVGACDDWANIAGKGIENLRFLRPVRPGMTLRATVRITGIDHQPQRHRALVTTEGRLVGEDGRAVMTMTSEAYMHQRPRD